MSGRKRNLMALVGVMLVLALAAAPIAAAHEGGRGKKGSPESKTDHDNHPHGSAESKTDSDNGSPESKTDSDKSKGSAGSKTNEDDGSTESKTNSDHNSGSGSKGSGKDASSAADAGKKSPIPGNNGTIKIDGEPYDTTRNNEPHVGCEFRVLYFGTDEGEGLTSTLTFAAHAPTSGDFTFTDTITLGDGEPDIAGPYNLVADLQAAGIVPHPQQGYHVKLTTNTEYSQGADVKHKVFWIQCDETEQTAAVQGASVESDAGADVLGSGLSRDVGAEVLGSSLSRRSDSEVAGAAAERGPSVAGERVGAAGGILPFTGGSVVAYILIGLGLVASGIAFMKLRGGHI